MSEQKTIPADNRVLAEEVYDMIMGEIEPDLLIANIPHLDATYAGETPAQHDARMHRYSAAYKKFDIAMAAFLNDIDGKVRATQRKTLRDKEAQAQQEDQKTINSLASAFG